jgi:hypothetical protein
VFECYGDGVVLRLGEDGYVSYEGGEVEVGILRDCGGAAEVRQFEDGAVYIYRSNVCGNGVFMGQMPVVYSDLNQVFVTATFGSIFLTLAELTGGNLRPYAQL